MMNDLIKISYCFGRAFEFDAQRNDGGCCTSLEFTPLEAIVKDSGCIFIDGVITNKGKSSNGRIIVDVLKFKTSCPSLGINNLEYAFNGPSAWNAFVLGLLTGSDELFYNNDYDRLERFVSYYRSCHFLIHAKSKEGKLVPLTFMLRYITSLSPDRVVLNGHISTPDTSSTVSNLTFDFKKGMAKCRHAKTSWTIVPEFSENTSWNCFQNEILELSKTITFPMQFLIHNKEK